MRVKFIILLFFCLQCLFFSSCTNRLIGIGVTQNHGNLQLKPDVCSDETDETAVGGYFEARLKKMYNEHGLGIDYNFTYRGYSSSCSDGGDKWLQTIQGKYYYNLINQSQNITNLDLSFGFGVGNYFLGSNLPTPLVSTLSLDASFPGSEKLYFSLRTGYVIELENKTQNFSLGLGVGICFNKN